MPEKSWTIPIPAGTRILILMDTTKGQINSFAVVLITELDDKPVCISRYDTAHGQAHRDVLGKKAGLIQKDWLVGLTFKQAFTYAITDFRNNHEQYIQFFLAN